MFFGRFFRRKWVLAEIGFENRFRPKKVIFRRKIFLAEKKYCTKNYVRKKFWPNLKQTKNLLRRNLFP